MIAKKPTLAPRPSSIRKLSLGHKVIVALASFVVAVLVAGSMWVAVLAVADQIKISKGTTQIIDLVDLSRKAIDTQRALTAPERTDLLSLLARMGAQFTISGDTNGFKSVTNPWGGALYVFTEHNSQFRINTTVPGHVCQRMIEFLSPNLNSLGILAIDATVSKAFSRQIYRANSTQDKLSEETISAGCYSDQMIEVGITFAMK